MNDTDINTEPKRPDSYPADQWEALMPTSRQWVAQHWEALMAKRISLPEDRAPQTFPPDAPTIVGESPSQDASVDMFGETVLRAADVVDPEALPEVIPEPVSAVVSYTEVESVTDLRDPWAATVQHWREASDEPSTEITVSAAVDVSQPVDVVDGPWVADEDERPTTVEIDPAPAPEPARVFVAGPPRRARKVPRRVGLWVVVDVYDDLEDQFVEFALGVHDIVNAWAVVDADDGCVLYLVGDGARAVSRWKNGETGHIASMETLNVDHVLQDVIEALGIA